MPSSLRLSESGLAALILAFAVACGGSSVSHVDDQGMAAAPGSGGSTGTTGGSSGTTGGGGLGGSSGTAGSAAGGSSGDAGTGGVSETGGDAGTAGISGSGGDGAGGTGGSTACATGNPCAMEGAGCSETACCSCMHTCKNGVWGPPLCPPCAAPLCPQNPPNDGDACNACSVPDGGCTWDERPTDGPLYTAQCVDARWAVDSQYANPLACCTSDEACGPSACPAGDSSCVTTACVNGSCEYAALGSPSHPCWRDDQCPTGEVCSGALVCGCSEDCGYRDEIGSCVPAAENCCLTDQDCNGTGICTEGVCKVAPSGSCYTDRDCGGGALCVNQHVCPCGAACLVADSPGSCAPYVD